MGELFGREGLEAAGGQGQVGGAAEEVAFLGREISAVLFGIDQAIALFGRHVTHAADGAVDGLAAVGRQLAQLLEELSGLLLLAIGEVFPGFHAGEDAILFLRREAGEMLQPSLQLHLPLGR